jgi:hypothetical protein
MLELEPLGERTLPTALGPVPFHALGAFVPHYMQADRALDAYELATGDKTLREEFDTAAGQVRGLRDAIDGALHPLVAAFMQATLGDYTSPPKPVLVTPSQAAAPGGEPVYFVNGILTSRTGAIADAQALANQIDRPVELLYNPTHGVVGDVVQTIADLLWFPPLPQPDGTARELTRVLLSAREQGRTVDVVGYSRGAATVNDALRAMDALSLGAWTYNDVAVLLVAAPLGPSQAAGTVRFQRIDNVGDPVVEFLGDRRDSLVGKLDPITFNLPVSISRHFFVPSYVGQITPALLF